MPGLYETLEKRVNQMAGALALPLGWEGKAFVEPAGPHLKAQVIFDDSRAASLGKDGLNKTTGRVVVRVVVNSGENVQAAGLASQVAAQFPRGEGLEFDTGTGTITTPQCGAPASDSLHSVALVTINFYAFHA